MSPERQANLFDNCIVPMLRLDMATSSITEANHAAAAFYGYSIEEMSGMPVATIETMKPEEVDDLMEGQRRSPEETGKVLQHRLADGSIRDVDVRIMMPPEPPNMTAYVVILDITAQQAAIRELDEHRARLQALLEGMDDCC